MPRSIHGHWIGAERRMSASGAVFEVVPGGPGGGPRTTYARAGAPEVAEAIAAAEDGARAWARTPCAARRQKLDAVLCELSALAAAGREPGTFLGLDGDEERERRSWELEGLESWAALRDAPGGAPALELVRHHWTGLLSGPAEAALGALFAGRAVLLLADARAPHAADLLGAAFAAAGLPPGAASVLFGPDPGAVEAAARAPLLAAVRATGTEGELARLDRALVEPKDGRPIEVEERLVRNRSRVVRAGDDLAREARRTVDLAFGRAATLSGQLADSLGRVLCEERVFSAFTDALLGEMEASPDVARPIPQVDAAAIAAARAVWELGLDEGATPVFGDEPSPRDDRRSRAMEPVVFTNVEPDLALARRIDPAPILSLVRVPGGGGGDELLAELG